MLRRQLLSKIAKKTIRMKSTIVIYLDLYKFKEKIQNGLQLKQTIRSITTLNKSIFKDIIMNKNPPGNKRCTALILFNKRYFSLINILYLSKISITKSGCYGWVFCPFAAFSCTLTSLRWVSHVNTKFKSFIIGQSMKMIAISWWLTFYSNFLLLSILFSISLLNQ